MNPDVTQYASFQLGELENGYRGVYIDGVKSGNQMITELVIGIRKIKYCKRLLQLRSHE